MRHGSKATTCKYGSISGKGPGLLVRYSSHFHAKSVRLGSQEFETDQHSGYMHKKKAVASG